MIEDSRSVMFSIEELLLLQAVIRHEQPQEWQGKWPAYSRELNDQIAEAIHFCSKYSVSERAILLSRGDLYAIDYCVPSSAKDAAGRPLGRSILLKTFEARQPDWGPDVQEPEYGDIAAEMATWQSLLRRPKRARTRQRYHDDTPGHDA